MIEQDKNEMSIQNMEDELAGQMNYVPPATKSPAFGRVNTSDRKTAVDELTESLKAVKEALTIVTALRKDLIGIDDKAPPRPKLEPVHSGDRVIFSAVRDLSTEIKGDAAEIVRMANLIRQGW
jgi:hypothetical protein